MQADKKLISKRDKQLAQLQSNVDLVEDDYAQYLQHCKQREDARLVYDHYRVKVEGLLQKAAKSAEAMAVCGGDKLKAQQKEQTKLNRNQQKFEVSQNDFKAAQKLIAIKSSELLNKISKIQKNLSIDFFEHVQRPTSNHYDQMFENLGNDFVKELQEIE